MFYSESSIFCSNLSDSEINLRHDDNRDLVGSWQTSEHCLCEKISAETRVRPLTALLSGCIGLSNAHASNKRRTPKSGMSAVPPRPPPTRARIREKRGLLPSSATLRKQGVLPVPAHAGSHRHFSCLTSVLTCFLVKSHRHALRLLKLIINTCRIQPKNQSESG